MVPADEQTETNTMSTAIGYVTHDPKTDHFKGTLRTLTIACGIEIIPNSEKTDDRQPDYRIVTDEETELGAAWRRTGKVSGNPYISLTLAATELGNRRLFANLGQASGQDDDQVYAIIGNPG